MIICYPKLCFVVTLCYSLYLLYMRIVKMENPLYRLRKSLLDCGIEIIVPASDAYQLKC